MPVQNPFSITYGGRTVGGGSNDQLHGPYVIERSYETFRLVFEVVVVSSSFSGLQSRCDDLEIDFSKRLTDGDTVVIDLDGSSWTYTMGTNLLACTATIGKSGNPDSDRGYSRAYTVSIIGELPAADDAGLRNVEVLVDYTPSRQRTVTMRGVYTAGEGGHAKAQYEADFDAEAQAYLDAIDDTATWELVDENYSLDRQRQGTTPFPHLCNFTRQYVELLADQSSSGRDDTEIRDHRVQFTDMAAYPGDSKENVRRLRRVIGTYDCAVNREETQDLTSIYEDKIKAHLLQLFRSEFSPSVFAIEDIKVSYDHTANRVSVNFQFVFQESGGEAIVEVSQSVAYRESRTIDYTPTHSGDDLAAEADVGWSQLERVWNRTVIVVGSETPKRRITLAPTGGDAGLFNAIAGETSVDTGDRVAVRADGWNVIANTSQVTPQWIGMPGEEQLAVMVLTETVVERYHRKPGPRTTNPVRRGPTTPGGG